MFSGDDPLAAGQGCPPHAKGAYRRGRVQVDGASVGNGTPRAVDSAGERGDVLQPATKGSPVSVHYYPNGDMRDVR